MRFSKLASIVGVLVLVVALPVLGQATGSTQGTITGTVSGPESGPIPGVQVTARSASLQGERTVITAANGAYVIRGLPPGSYELTYELEGMASGQQAVKVEANGVASVDMQMQVEGVAENIVVQAESVAALENSTVGGNYEAEELDKMPVTRTLFGIATLSPGVTTTGTEVAGQISINGGFNFDSIWLVDGVDVSDSVFSNGSPLFIEEALEEQQVLTSGVSAEYGRFTGGLVHAITKSGGNQFQGSVRMDMDNPEWRDETPREDDLGIERIDNRNETYSATLGGYFVQDHLWFFGAFRNRDVETQSTLFKTSLPLAQPQTEDRWEAKLTGNIGDRHTLQATYLDRDFAVVRGSLSNAMTYDMVETAVQPWELRVGRYSGVLTDRLYIEAQYSEKDETLTRSASGFSTDIRDSPFRTPNPAVAGAYNGIYFDPNDPDKRNNEQAAVSLSWFLDTDSGGTHDLKFGYEDFTNTNIAGNSQSPTDWVFFATPVLDSAGNVVLINGKAQPTFVPGRSFSTYGVFFQAVRGAQLDLEVQSFFVNDRWQLGEHWSFNLGGRYELVDSKTNAGAEPVDTDAISPRLAVAYDLNGDGRYIFDATYGQYTGGYGFGGNSFDAVTNVGNPSYVYGPYLGPAGAGVDFAPGFNPNNYDLYLGSDPKASATFRDDVGSPEVEEWTASFGYRLPRNGWLKATYINRETTNFIEDIIDIANGTSIIQIQDATAEVTNRVFDNSDVPIREYEGFVLQGRYNFMPRWFVEGSWTYQMQNHGNYEGEAGQAFGASSFQDFVPLLDERNSPFGRLDDFQQDKVRAWSIYTQPLGRFGDLSFSLLGNYDTGSAYSYAQGNVARTPVQTALNPGYPDLFGSQTLFFGPRGAETFDDYWSADFALLYELPIWKRLDLFVKADVFNITNEDSLISHNISVSGDPASPLDSLGRRTGFRKSAAFGTPVSDASFIVPREYRFSVGFRF